MMFGRRTKKAVAMLCACFGMAATSTVVQADPIDAYRDMIARKSYTLKYENITPETRQTNRNRVHMMNGKMDDPMSTMYHPSESIVVCDGDNRYEESGWGVYAACRLQRGEELFNFSRIQTGKKPTYVGTVGNESKQGAVSAVVYDRMQSMATGPRFGDNQMSRFLNAIMPNNEKPNGSTLYTRVGSGTLGNGLSYVDYKADVNSDRSFEAIRYYFQGNQLVKIASGQYYVNDRGELDGVRYIIKINEFSSTPDKSYLSLPTGLQDKTKRDKQGKIVLK